MGLSTRWHPGTDLRTRLRAQAPPRDGRQRIWISRPMSTALYGPARRALVLAGGGITGGLYQVGALMALDALFRTTSRAPRSIASRVCAVFETAPST